MSECEFAARMRAAGLAASIAIGAALVLGSSAAIAQTMIGGKTNAAFPIVISADGSYKLRANLSPPVGTDGIVLTDGVHAVIDLNGYTINGGANCSYWSSNNCFNSSGSAGIRVPGNSTAQVANGRIRGFTRAGILGEIGGVGNSVIARNIRIENNAVGLSAHSVIAENVTAYDNWGSGIYGNRGSIINSMALINGQGITLHMGTVAGCVARGNGTTGFIFQRTTHRDNVAWDNGEAMTLDASSPGMNNNYDGP